MVNSGCLWHFFSLATFTEMLDKWLFEWLSNVSFDRGPIPPQFNVKIKRMFMTKVFIRLLFISRGVTRDTALMKRYTHLLHSFCRSVTFGKGIKISRPTHNESEKKKTEENRPTIWEGNGGKKMHKMFF